MCACVCTEYCHRTWRKKAWWVKSLVILMEAVFFFFFFFPHSPPPSDRCLYPHLCLKPLQACAPPRLSSSRPDLNTLFSQCQVLEPVLYHFLTLNTAISDKVPVIIVLYWTNGQYNEVPLNKGRCRVISSDRISKKTFVLNILYCAVLGIVGWTCFFVQGQYSLPCRPSAAASFFSLWFISMVCRSVLLYPMAFRNLVVDMALHSQYPISSRSVLVLQLWLLLTFFQ